MQTTKVATLIALISMAPALKVDTAASQYNPLSNKDVQVVVY